MKERSFQPGDRVLALLPMPQNPLQAKYYGPYTVDRKINDLNYIINTPGRRKQNQVCHINMLKEYIERDNHIKHVIGLVAPVPNSEGISSDSTDFEMMNDMEMTNLCNSEIMKNLDQKLSHFQVQERTELKQ